MNAPIIYIIQRSNKSPNTIRNIMPDDEILPDDEVLERIPECTEYTPNTFDEIIWDRDHWVDSYEELLSKSNNYNVNNHNDNLNITFSKDHILNWLKEYTEIQRKHADSIQDRIDNKNVFSSKPFLNNQDKDTFNKYFSRPFGGVRFALFEDNNVHDELSYYDLFSEIELIEYVKDQFCLPDAPNDEITFDICKNVSGDYRY